ncbi:MAG: M3 family metallopeptidase [Betaproteobacteria bacterium]|nr:M3 family metallopeptidase [Betaproteobacteria bacterium]
MDNPLLDFRGLPRFAEFAVAHVTPAIESLLAENRAVVAQVASASTPPTWDNFVQPLEDAGEKLSRAWGQVAHLNAVKNSPELREVYNALLPKLTEFYTEMAQNEALYRRYKELAASAEFARLDAAQQRIVGNELRDFRLGGAELAAPAKERFKAVQEELANLAARFEQNVLDATDAYGLVIDDASRLAGLPQDQIEAARAEAERAGVGGWRFTLHAPSYLPALQYADDRELRATLYRAYVTRASEFGPAEHDNTALLRRILELRQEEARVLGYGNYAEVSLVPKMAQTPAEVLEFLRELARKARPYAQRDLAELQQFGRGLGFAEVAAWDVAYLSEKLRKARYDFSDQEVKEYFPEDRVIAGMFRVVETIFGIHIRETAAPVWHDTVRFFEIEEAGRPVGQFYLDLYARPHKRGGAWMDDAINRRSTGQGTQRPVTYLTCNFSAPVGGRPALFTHDEVLTLFHEFGHGLHQLLTEIDHLGASGLANVEWDAVELPSQFMENFCWEWDVLKHMTARVDIGTPLPRALFDKMLAARNFQSGLQMLRQLEFSLFDFLVHGDYDPAGDLTPLGMLERVRQEVAVLMPPEFNRFPNTFTHIFASGYAAGYYSYKWAEVLSADAYSLFEELGALSPEAGRRFRGEVLARGGSRPALSSFVAFRGRPPRIDALLRHNGMTSA